MHNCARRGFFLGKKRNEKHKLTSDLMLIDDKIEMNGEMWLRYINRCGKSEGGMNLFHYIIMYMKMMYEDIFFYSKKNIKNQDVNYIHDRNKLEGFLLFSFIH